MPTQWAVATGYTVLHGKSGNSVASCLVSWKANML